MNLAKGKDRRVGVGGSIVAAFAALGCSPPDRCERIETVIVAAWQGCPTSDEAAEDQKHLIRAELVDAVVDPAVTICWYRAEYSSTPPGRAENSLDECSEPYTRASLSNDLHAPYNLSYYIMACDEDRLLYGVKIRGPSALEEAILSTEGECPGVMEAEEYGQHWQEELVLSEFVGADFFEALLRCEYEFVYKCKDNRGGLIDLGGF